MAKQLISLLPEVSDSPGLFILEEKNSWRVFQKPLGQVWCTGGVTYQRMNGVTTTVGRCFFSAVEALLVDKNITLGGYLGYGLLHELESVPAPPGHPTIPDGFFYLYQADNIESFFHQPIELPALRLSSASLEERMAPYLTESKNSYLEKIVLIQELIRRGEIYQLNLSQRFISPFRGSAFGLFSNLVGPTTRTAYGYLSAATDSSFQIVSASPERFVTIDSRSVVCSPIKGTIGRGSDAAADQRNIECLRSSEKDRAELAMIVDVIRNDLGKVAEIGSVTVTEHARLDSFPTLHHLVSEIIARLPEQVSTIQVLKALFPSASITGAPKIAAMRYIAQFETAPREVYTGAIGWLNSESANFNVAIRTAVVTNDQIRFSTGGGITISSDPEAEYQETLVKALSLTTALTTP